MYLKSLSLLFITAACLVPSLTAAPTMFFANLDGASESPSNASLGTGTALVTIDAMAHTLRVETEFMGLTTGNTASHIHVINGPGDSNTADTLGPVATITPTFPGFPTGATSGSYAMTFDTTLTSSYRGGWLTDSGGTAALAEAQLFSGISTGRAYLNIHSSTFPGGEIRGFLTLIPEPSALVLAALAMASLGVLLRRKS